MANFLGLKVSNSIPYPPDKKSINNPDGIKLKINLTTLVDRVYISPEADLHFKELVERLLDKMDLQNISYTQSER